MEDSSQSSVASVPNVIDAGPEDTGRVHADPNAFPVQEIAQKDPDDPMGVDDQGKMNPGGWAPKIFPRSGPAFGALVVRRKQIFVAFMVIQAQTVYHGY